MQGKIKMFNISKSFGFIVGDDGNDYFVHSANIEFEDHPVPGMSVEFVPSTGTKGLVAKQVTLVVPEKMNRPAFFRCGNTRIRLNNIKDYRIDMASCYQISIFNTSTLQECDKLPVTTSIDDGYCCEIKFFDEVRNLFLVTQTGKLVKNSDGKITLLDSQEKINEFLEWNRCACLFIDTYQGDHFAFFNGELTPNGSIDIYEKLNELDSYFL